MQYTTLLFLAFLVAAGGVQAAEEKLQRKSGLWELKRTSSVTSGQTRVYQMCVEQASDSALSPLADGSPGELCETSKLQREGDRLSVDATCKMPQSAVVATTHALITGQFDSAYRVESKTTFNPAVRGHAESSAVLEAKWTGPCKADQRPGDVVGPRGVKFNIAGEKTRGEKNTRNEKSAKSEKTGKKRGGYKPAPDSAAPGLPSTPAPPPGTQTK